METGLEEMISRVIEHCSLPLQNMHHTITSTSLEQCPSPTLQVLPLFFLKERENNSSSTSMPSLTVKMFPINSHRHCVCASLQQCFLSFLLAFGFFTSLCNVYSYYELHSPGAILVKIARRATTALFRLLFSGCCPLEKERMYTCIEQEMG